MTGRSRSAELMHVDATGQENRDSKETEGGIILGKSLNSQSTTGGIELTSQIKQKESRTASKQEVARKARNNSNVGRDEKDDEVAKRGLRQWGAGPSDKIRYRPEDTTYDSSVSVRNMPSAEFLHTPHLLRLAKRSLDMFRFVDRGRGC